MIELTYNQNAILGMILGIIISLIIFLNYKIKEIEINKKYYTKLQKGVKK